VVRARRDLAEQISAAPILLRPPITKINARPPPLRVFAWSQPAVRAGADQGRIADRID
jgi:hypothetical protein